MIGQGLILGLGPCPQECPEIEKTGHGLPPKNRPCPEQTPGRPFLCLEAGFWRSRHQEDRIRGNDGKNARVSTRDGETVDSNRMERSEGRISGRAGTSAKGLSPTSHPKQKTRSKRPRLLLWVQSCKQLFPCLVRGAAPNVLLWGLYPQIPRGSRATDIALWAPSRPPPGGLRTAFDALIAGAMWGSNPSLTFRHGR